MTVNVELLLVTALNSVDGLPETHPEVPSRRPASFITIERVGGGYEDVRDLPMVAVQCWERSRLKAAELSAEVASALRKLAYTHPNIGRVNIESIINFPDPDSSQARYQVTVSLVTKN